ncbi:Hypothetical protein SMAX5B_003593, partial [Scophthalmus maximus]
IELHQHRGRTVVGTQRRARYTAANQKRRSGSALCVLRNSPGGVRVVTSSTLQYLSLSH